MTVPLKPLKELFLLALEVPADDRAEWLDRECAGDEALREQLNLMLAAHDAPHTLLDQPSKLQLRDTLAQPINEKPGTEIGPYKLLQQVGEGGMGVVYLAEQKDPVKRRVALKIIKPGMDTRQVIARFEAERQALAMMDHPNIAKVLDAGATKSGRPYFVMELVNGVSITQYCDEQHLTPKERLDLFVPICQAVQHAHQKGIIHRDLKPSNILVAEYDHRAVPKIIDFGVAKATSQTLTEKTMFTQLGQIVGTLEYMSPEQAKRNQLDVDTRSDIYSLGVVLYELLTGETPFDRERLRSAAFDEMLRIIREEEPSKPSTKVSSSQSLPSIAANRRIEPTKLGSMIRGELDWIVLKAMEKDRARRYETASKFAEDVQHYLNDEPVVACPPSRAYKFRKFARRNKVAIATSAAIMLCLIGGIVGTVSQARWAIQERNRAIDAEKEAQRNLQLATASESRANDQAARAVEEAENATTQAAIAKAINDFLNNDLLAQADPDYQPNRDITLRSLLDLAATRLDGRFPDQPLVEAAIHETIGRTYLSLGEVENAQLHNRMALKLQQRALGPEHPQTIKSMYLLANAINPHKPTPNVTYESSKTAKEAETLIREALQIQRRVLGYEHPDTLEGMHQLARSIDFQGRHAEAEQLYCDLLEIVERVLDVKSRLALSVRRSLAWSIYKQGRHSEAEETLQKTLEFAQQAIGPEHRFTLVLMNDLVLFMGGQGKHSEREQLGRELLKIKQRALGPDNPSTLMQVGNLAASIMAQGRYAEAEEMLAENWKTRLRILGPEHRYTKTARYQMIDLYRELGAK